MNEFTLNERLKNDTFEVMDLRLCRVLLMNDASFAWLILVPKREGVTEVHALSKEDRISLIEETAAASRAISAVCSPDKINIGALGNLVAQLHVHVIGRTKTDRAWPGPVWGSGQGRAYGKDELASVISALRRALQEETATQE